LGRPIRLFFLQKKIIPAIAILHFTADTTRNTRVFGTRSARVFRARWGDERDRT
jgi:hypothetical protein